ncbi:hypothetical protein HPB50_002356 [Hyalomma asiaticum]|uniref:Uncharacterized protein n=1 Tax=Hyalomma asiaticum TaxID=266040 RepID=A0ACB7TDM3_HYAAI|nr:hypothetical protein HPB50_002356 [Hyalomma asiaticum]
MFRNGLGIGASAGLAQEKSFLGEFSDDDFASALLTNDIGSSTSLSVAGRRRDCSKAILIAGLAITLLVLSTMVITWKRKEKPEFVPPSGAVVPPLKDPPNRRVLAGRYRGMRSARNVSGFPRKKQFIVPGKRAFAGEQTTEFSMMEIADVNFDSLRTKKVASPETYTLAEPEVNEPFRQDTFTVHWRAAVGRKDAGPISKSPFFWINVNDTASVTPNLVRRFIGRRGFSVAPTTTTVKPNGGGGLIWGIDNGNISLYVIRFGRNKSANTRATGSNKTTPSAFSWTGITASTSKMTIGNIGTGLTSENATESFIKWDRLPEASDNAPPSKFATSAGAVPNTSVTKQGSRTVQNASHFSGDKSVASLAGAPTAHGASWFSEPSFGSHVHEATRRPVTTHPSVSGRRRQDRTDKEIGRIIPILDFDEPKNNDSSGRPDVPYWNAPSVPSQERFSQSTELTVFSAQGKRQGQQEGKREDVTPPHFLGVVGQKTAVVGADVKTRRVDVVIPESPLDGIDSAELPAGFVATNETSELSPSIPTVATGKTPVTFSGSKHATIISNRPNVMSRNNGFRLYSLLPEKSTAESYSASTVVSSSPTDFAYNGDRNLQTLATIENEKTLNESARTNETVSRSAQNNSSDLGSEDTAQQPRTVTNEHMSQTPPLSLSGGKIRDDIILDIGTQPPDYESATKVVSLGQPVNITRAVAARANHETVASTNSDTSLAGNITEHNGNGVEREVTSTALTQSQKKYVGLLKVGNVTENADRGDISPLNLFRNEGAHPSAQPTTTSSNDTLSVETNGTKYEEKKETLSTKNTLVVEVFNATKGVHEEKAWTEQRQTGSRSSEHMSRESVLVVSRITTGVDVRPTGENESRPSGLATTLSSWLGSEPSIQPSSSVIPGDAARNEVVAEGKDGGARREVQATPSSFHETRSSSPSAFKSSLSLSSEITTTQVSSHRTRRRIRMSRRGRYRKRLVTKETTTSITAAPVTSETAGQTRNRYPTRKHAKKRHHAKPTPTAKLSSEYGNIEAEKRYLKSTSSQVESYETPRKADGAIRNAGAGGDANSSTTEGAYKRKIKPVEITHRHGLNEKHKVAVTKSTKTPSESLGTPAIGNGNKSDLELFGDQVNDTDLLDDIYHHAGMNIWKFPKDASGLQKEHPGHKRKQRAHDNRKLLPRMMSKRTALTRPPYKAPIEWSAERKRAANLAPPIAVLTTTSAASSDSSQSYTPSSLVTLTSTGSPDTTSETPGDSNSSNDYAPIIHTFSHELNDTNMNTTEISSGNGLLDIEHELNDLRVSSFNSSSEQSNETGPAKTTGTDASSQTTTTTVATLVPVVGSATAVRCSTADCMEEGGRLHAFTDITLKPCTNFYEFACSGWIRSHPYPPNRKKVSVDDLVVQLTEQKTMEFIYENVLDHATYTDPLLHNVVKLFQGCSDKSFLMRNPAMALQAALDDVRLTDWPYDEEPMDVEVSEVIAFAARKLAVNPFFVPSLEVDSTTGSGWVFLFREPKAVVPEDAYLVGDVVSTYQKLVTQAMSLVNSDKNIQALAEPVLYVDQEVHKMVEQSRRLTDFTKEHYRKSLQHLDKRREFDVGSFLSTLLDGIAVLDSEVEFVVPTTTFLEDVQNLTMAFEKNVLLNYIGFRVLLALSPLLPHNDGRDLAHLQFAREIPTRTPAKRWRFCLRLLEGIYKLPLIQLQVDSFEKKDNFHTINRTMELLKKHLFRNVRNSSRFGHIPRQMIIAKLRDLKVQSFSSHFIGDAEVREKHYHGVPDVDPSNVLTDYVQTLNIVLKNYWSYYGSIGPNFRPLYFPRSGRRIMEGLYSMLEREASFFGSHNEVVKTSSWDYITTDGYLSLRGCLKEQYRKAAMPHLGAGLTSALQPSRSLRQDIKDNAIINVVIEAFKETMLDFGYKPGQFVLPGFAQTSMEQLFFLLYGTSQCEVTSQEAALADEIIRASHPRRYRVNHALQNNAIFSGAFMCATETEMNPKKKCKVW